MKSIIATAILLAATTQAAIVFDTLSATQSGSYIFKGPGGQLPYAELGFTMHVPALSDYQLDSLTFSFGNAVFTSIPFELAAFTTGSGTPQGALLTTFSGPTTASNIEGTFTPDSTLTLAADTDVFFRFKVAATGGTYTMKTTEDILGPSDWSLTQTYIGNILENWTPNARNPMMQVAATAVPEPGTGALLGAAALFLALRRRP